MTHEHQTDRIRRLVSHTFAELGFGTGELRETILIRGGQYCGRRFELAGASAIWFVEENEIKIYRAGGPVTQVLEPGNMHELRRVAA